MDPLTALSLAANVIQFVDFAYKLVSGSKEIYNSASGLTAENDVLETIAQDVWKFTEQIPNSSQYGSSNAGVRLHKLAVKSEELAESILRILESLKRDGKKPSKWTSFVHLLRSMHKAPELRMLIDQINKLQGQINTSLTYLIR